MKIIKDPAQKLNIKTVVALGCFDGVHTAHAKVISEAVRIAREKGLCSVIWCFSEPPKNAYLKEPVPLICDGAEKARLIRILGADVLIEPDFTREISRISPEDFVKSMLFENAGAVHLVCGRDYTFGAGGVGDTLLLSKLCRELGMELSVVDDVRVDGVNVSSTLVRDAVSNGQCIYAAKLLGRNFSLCFDEDEDNEPLSCGRSLFSIDKKQLCPCESDYGVEVYCGGYKKKCIAKITYAEQGRMLTLDTHIDISGRVRIEFYTNKNKAR